MPKLVNMYGIKYLIEGDVGSPEAKRLMCEAKSDLDVLKENNVLELDHIRLDKPNKYLINSQFGEDTVYINIPFKEKKRRLVLKSEEEKVKQEQETKYLIAFEAYNSTGQQIGYVLCTDGKLGGYKFVPTDNVINPHPIYPFNPYRADTDDPSFIDDWEEWFLEQRESRNSDIVYPFHFSDWKLGTGWAEYVAIGDDYYVGGYYRGFDNPVDYVSLANPYPLDELSYPHSGKPFDKIVFIDESKIYYDISQDTKFEEKLMNWVPEASAIGLEGSERAFTVYITETLYEHGGESQIHCEYYDPRDSSTGQIRGVKRSFVDTYSHRESANTGITVTTKDKAIKLLVPIGEGGIMTYADQWDYPWVSGIRFLGDGSYISSKSGVQYRTVADARDWYVYNTILTYDNFMSVENLGYDYSQYPFSTYTKFFYGELNSYLIGENESELYYIVASVAENESKYAALVRYSSSYSLSYTDYTRTGTPCGKSFSPEYYIGMPDPDESACTHTTNSDSDSHEEYESFLIINNQRVELFGEEYLGISFIRWWEEAGWIALNLSFLDSISYESVEVKYQLWNSETLEKIVEVDFDPIVPTEEFFNGLDRWEEGYQTNWHNIPDESQEGGLMLEPDGEPLICSGHFRCFKVTTETDKVKTRQTTELVVEE
jgi:hypothetical protein